MFTSGNLSKNDLIDALIKSKNSIRNLCSSNGGPFSASISKGGKVTLRDLKLPGGKL